MYCGEVTNDDAILYAGSGRLSFTFALKGPALSVDTACSSSLVAAHLAAGYMARGVSTAGLAAGVGLLLNPATTAMFQKVCELSSWRVLSLYPGYTAAIIPYGVSQFLIALPITAAVSLVF